MEFKSTFALAICSAFLLLGHPHAASADKGGDLNFFPNNMANNMFGSDVQMLMPKMHESKDEEQEQKTAEPADNKSAQQDVKDISQNEDAAKEKTDPAADTMSLRDQLEKKYGSPSVDPAVRVQDNAPLPFKAMMEALNKGDRELAMDYAQQYVRVLQKEQKFSGDVVSIVGQVMKNSGQAHGTDWDNIQPSREDKLIIERKRNEKIDENLKIAAAITPEAISGTSVANEKTLAMSRDRKKIHFALSRETDLANDRKGVVALFYFVDPTNAGMRAETAEIDRLTKLRAADPRVTVIGVSTKPISAKNLEIVNTQSKLNFMLRDGTELAKKFHVHTSPSVAFVLPDEKQVLIKEGPVTFEYADELISKIQGAAKL